MFAIIRFLSILVWNVINADYIQNSLPLLVVAIHNYLSYLWVICVSYIPIHLKLPTTQVVRSSRVLLHACSYLRLLLSILCIFINVHRVTVKVWSPKRNWDRVIEREGLFAREDKRDRAYSETETSIVSLLYLNLSEWIYIVILISNWYYLTLSELTTVSLEN